MSTFNQVKEWAHAHPATSFLVATFRLYSLMTILTRDIDARFTGKFWRELMSLYGCELLFSTAFHPQTDGMAEVTNRTLK